MPPTPGYATPPGYAPAPQSNVIRNAAIGVGTLVVLMLVAAVAIPVFLQRQPVKAPATLGGYSVLHDDATRAQLKDLEKSLQESVPGHGMVVAAYGDAGDPRLLLAGLRLSEEDRSEFLRGGEAGMRTALNGSAVQSFGDIKCMSAGQVQVAACLWEGDVSGIVVVIGSRDLTSASAVAAEARGALN